MSQKNVPLGEVCPSPKGTFFLGHPVYVGMLFGEFFQTVLAKSGSGYKPFYIALLPQIQFE